jgi:hypothetical protein
VMAFTDSRTLQGDGLRPGAGVWVGKLKPL